MRVPFVPFVSYVSGTNEYGRSISRTVTSVARTIHHLIHVDLPVPPRTGTMMMAVIMESWQSMYMYM